MSVADACCPSLPVQMSMLVLDEADRMLDMGFEPQIRDLMDFMPGMHADLRHSYPTATVFICKTSSSRPAVDCSMHIIVRAGLCAPMSVGWMTGEDKE